VTDEWWHDLPREDLVDLVSWLFAADPELEARMRAEQRAQSGDVTELPSLVDQGLRTRRFLDWRQTREYADGARPILNLLHRAVETTPSQQLVELLQRALSHVLQVLHRADDDGLVGGVFDELLDLHVRVCQSGSPDPLKLAKWLVSATYDGDWFSPPDPVSYAAALGDTGERLYRGAAQRELASADPSQPYSTALSHGRYAVERLAVIDRDPDAVVASFSHIERASYREAEIAEGMREIGRDDLALEHARAGLATGVQFDQPKLTQIADAILVSQGDDKGLLELRRAAHMAHPTRSSFAGLRDAASALGSWKAERPTAIVALGRSNPGELVVVLLDEGRIDEAWAAYEANASARMLDKDLLALIEVRSVEHPGDAMDAYLRLADGHLASTGREHYERAVRLLKKADAPARRAAREADLREHVRTLRETHKRRPTFIALLNRAGLDA
jgi:hypothetical protein